MLTNLFSKFLQMKDILIQLSKNLMKYSATCVLPWHDSACPVQKCLSWAGHERSALIGQIRSLVSCGTKHSWPLARPSIAKEIFCVVFKQGYAAEYQHLRGAPRSTYHTTFDSVTFLCSICVAPVFFEDRAVMSKACGCRPRIARLACESFAGETRVVCWGVSEGL